MSWITCPLLYVTNILISYTLHKTRYNKLGIRIIIFFRKRSTWIFHELDDVNVTMFRCYFIFKQMALLEEWKSIGLRLNVYLDHYRKRQVSCKTWKSPEFLQCERYVTSPYFSFHTSVTGKAISEDWVSYNVEKWNLLFAKKWNLLFFKKWNLFITVLSSLTPPYSSPTRPACCGGLACSWDKFLGRNPPQSSPLLPSRTGRPPSSCPAPAPRTRTVSPH